MRYFIGFLVTIGLLIFLIILLVTGGGGSPKKSTAPKKLYDYASTDASVSMLISGQINSDLLHREIKVTVDRNNVTYQDFRGYNGDVTNKLQFPNTESAYYNFLRALYFAGYTNGSSSKDTANETGLCPLGQRYVFNMVQDGKELQRYWVTSCGGTKTYEGNQSLTVNLFQMQVPDYITVSSDVEL